MQVTVDYSIWLGVTVDTETGKVVRVEHGDDVSAQEPESYWNGEGSEPEYLEPTHPEAVKAQAIADRVSIRGAVEWREKQ